MASPWDDAVWRHTSEGQLFWWLSSATAGACHLTIDLVGDAYWITDDGRTDPDHYELGPLESLDLAKKAYRVLLATHRY